MVSTSARDSITTTTIYSSSIKNGDEESHHVLHFLCDESVVVVDGPRGSGALQCGGRTSNHPNLGAPFKRRYADDAGLKKTVLYDFHVKNGGKMVEFAGFSMPIQYKDSIMEATQHCRTKASLFDVSHMLRVVV